MGEEETFIIDCISNKCTVVHVGVQKLSTDQIQDEINRGTEFGNKLKQAMDEVARL